MTAVIETDGLGKRYRKLWALTDCTLSIPAGRVVGLVGPNGAGKTTLIDVISSTAPLVDSWGRVTGSMIILVDLAEQKQLEEIARTKQPDLTAADLDAAVRTIAGSARSMGVDVEGV